MTIVFERVQDVLENYKSSVYEQDADKFVAAYASDIHAYDCWQNWSGVGIDAWSAMVNEWFSGLRKEGLVLRVGFDDVATEENDKLAFVRCAVTYQAFNAAEERVRQITNRFTFGLKKENGGWLIVHEHSSLPIDMATGKGIFDAKR